MDISLKQTFDAELIESIMSIDEIANAAADSIYFSNCFTPRIDELNGWLICYEGKELAGIINLHHENSTTLQIHPYMLNSKKKYCRDMMRALYNWFVSEVPMHVNKITANIPECYKKTVNFSRKVGFIEEGYRKEGYNSGDEYFGVYLMGITRKEIEGYLNG